jgi:phosphoribosyl-ATP pyrophosphohydrolase/phosphoribosyl-AMP cyclohydrolase
MIIPSIDIMGGAAVQLKQGKDLLLTDPRDPVELACHFNRFGPVAIVDLDAALGRGSNTELIARCCKVADCRVGGGIRTADDVRNWIKRGAHKVVIGTMATPEFLKQFPRPWIVAAIDARGQRIVDQGWTRDTGADVVRKAEELEEFCGEFLFTQVEREGMLAGADLETARRLKAAVATPITVAGGISSADEVAAMEAEGFSSQLGRAVYENKLDLCEAWTRCVTFNDQGLVPTVVQDAASGDVLMLAWSNAESIRAALSEGIGCYWSRSRQELWRKGQTSGHTQKLVAARFDCDRDTVLFRVEQSGAACHTGRDTCFGDRRGRVFEELYATLSERKASIGEGGPRSYTQKLLSDPALLAAKLREETEEVIVAPNLENLRWECGDLLFHLMVRMVGAGVTLEEVAAELRGRVRARE